MPTTHLRLNEQVSPVEGLPDILKTKSGTVMLEIQGIINIGAQPLIRTELDLDSDSENKSVPSPQVLIGDLDLTRIEERGCPVKLTVGDNQLLRGTISKLNVPLAVMDVSDSTASETDVVAIITHKVIFSKRPEPVLKTK